MTATDFAIAALVMALVGLAWLADRAVIRFGARRAARREAAMTPAELLAVVPAAACGGSCGLAVERAERLARAALHAVMRGEAGEAKRFITGTELQLTAAITWLRHQVLTGPAARRTNRAASLERLEARLAEVTGMKAALNPHR